MSRNEALQKIRPEIKFDTTKKSLDDENFQNNTLRPILKTQHDIIIQLLSNSLSQQKLPTDKKELQLYITQYLSKNLPLKYQLFGICIGLFTDIEIEYYLQNQKTVHARLSQLLLKKTLDMYMH